MTGSLLQLRHTGAADITFTGNPQMTFLNQFSKDIQILQWNVSNKI